MSGRVSGRHHEPILRKRTDGRAPPKRPPARAGESDQKYGFGTTFTSIGAPYHFSQVSLTKLLECNE